MHSVKACRHCPVLWGLNLEKHVCLSAWHMAAACLSSLLDLHPDPARPRVVPDTEEAVLGFLEPCCPFVDSRGQSQPAALIVIPVQSWFPS